MLFSQRKGLKVFRDSIQKNDVDEELKHGLWNVFHVCIWSKLKYIPLAPFILSKGIP